MLILKIEKKDMELVGGLTHFIEEVFLKRNWDVFLTLVIKISEEDINNLKNLKKLSRHLDIRFEINSNQNETKELIYKSGLMTIDLKSPNIRKIIDFSSKISFSTIDDSMINLLDFEKGLGLIPTIVQDKQRTVLMLAYSSRESLKQTIITRRATYFSRSRDKLWVKGEKSGNFQIIQKIRFDCDADSLLFIVDQKGFACHTGTYSCFQEREFSLSFLYDIINNRIKNSTIFESYTKKLSKDAKLLLSKILEESLELINYTDRENLIWEIADLTYFILVLMATKQISIEEIENELRRRNK